MNCPNLCTAEKCARLEARIDSLENILGYLQLDYTQHTQDPIPVAHAYNPTLAISSFFEDNITNYVQFIEIKLDDLVEFTTVDVPNQYLDPQMFLEVNNLTDYNYELRFNFNGTDAYTNFAIPEPEPFFVTADVFDLGNNQFNLSVGINGDFDESFFAVDVAQTDEHVKSNLIGSASFRDDTLTISIADGESQDTFSTFIPITELNSTTFITEQVYMNCDELEQLIINLENNVTNQLNSIESAVTIDISGQVDSEFECVESTNSEDVTSIVPNFNAINYQGSGLLGLHNMLKLTNNNLTSVYSELCAVQNNEQTDVVSLVASDRFINKISGKLLILHFVTFDNYPKRERNSSYREVQIPAPKETFTWIEDFNDLRWHQGNQYAELRFVENYVPVSGYFKDEAAANSYFDAVLNLTTASEDNRVISKHSNPKMAIPERETRPYRAFIESVNEAGQAVCEVKYTPPNTNE